MSSSTDQLNALSGHHSPDLSTGGKPARIWAADVVTVNPDGSVDCQPVSSRATKVGVLCPGGYTPTVGDRILVTDLNGDPRTPIVLVAVSATAASSVTSFDGRKGPVSLTKADVTGTGLAAADIGALSATSQQLFSPGDLKLSAVPSAPAGWLPCDGSAVSRATFAALYAALGGAASTWGQGDGSTTFNLPDLRGRVPLGAGTGTAAGATAHTLGPGSTTGAGGEETHLLTAAESGLPSHNHVMSGATSTGANYNNTAVAGNNGVSAGQQVAVSSTGPTNASSAHNIMQPSATVNYFIKT